jgi:UDP-N-acetyl-D-mannosaminuronate dehydrogenase
MDLAADTLANCEGKEVLILGLAYRAGVKEDAFSGTLDLIRLSTTMGCTTFVHDWMYSDAELLSRGMHPLTRINYESISLIIIQNSDVKNIETLSYSFPNCELILDGRNLLATDQNATKVLSTLTDAKVAVLGNFI